MTDTAAITAANYRATLHPADGAMPGPEPRIFVDNQVAEARSEQLAGLVFQEEQLGARRWSSRGLYSDVDDLYDRLNAEIGRVKLEIAREVLVFLASDVTGNIDTAIAGAEFDRHAGCTSCGCTPGVTAGSVLYWQGQTFYVNVETL